MGSAFDARVLAEPVVAAPDLRGVSAGEGAGEFVEKFDDQQPVLIENIVAQMLYFVDEDRQLLGLAPEAGDLGTEGSLGDCAGTFGGSAESPAMDSLSMSSTLPVVRKSPHTQHRAGCRTKSARQTPRRFRNTAVTLPSRPNGRHGEMLWSVPNHRQILSILHGLRYDGRVVSGRSRTRKPSLRKTRVAVLQSRAICGRCKHPMAIERRRSVAAARRGGTLMRLLQTQPRSLRLRSCQSLHGEAVYAAVSDFVVAALIRKNIVFALAVREQVQTGFTAASQCANRIEALCAPKRTWPGPAPMSGGQSVSQSVWSSPFSRRNNGLDASPTNWRARTSRQGPSENHFGRAGRTDRGAGGRLRKGLEHTRGRQRRVHAFSPRLACTGP